MAMVSMLVPLFNIDTNIYVGIYVGIYIDTNIWYLHRYRHMVSMLVPLVVVFCNHNYQVITWMTTLEPGDNL